MSKITLQSVSSIDNSLINAINNNNATITTAIDNTLSRNGAQPNPMTAPLDMNSNPILNLPYAAQPTSPIPLGQLSQLGVINNPVPIGFPTMVGDATGTVNTLTGQIPVTVVKVDGVSYPASPSTNTVPVVTSSNTVTYEAVPNAALSTMANNTVKSNISGGVAIPLDNTLSAILDATMGNVQGQIIYRGVSAWQILAVGTANQVLISGGPGQNVSWSSSAGGGSGIGTLYTHAAITGGL